MSGKIRKENRWILLTFLCASAIQMPQFALNSCIATIHNAFSSFELSTIQTVASLPNLLSMVSALVSAFLIGRRIITKKTSVVTGLLLFTLAGVFAAVLHTEFWHLCVYNVLLGWSIGMFISTCMSIMFDNLNDDERRIASGLQTVCVNSGCILMSLLAGWLATFTWYAAYIMLIIAAPVAIIAIKALPSGQKTEAANTKARTKLPKDLIFFALIMFVFNLTYHVCGNNISTHLAKFGNSAIAGFATAIQMLGGVFVGIVFRRISKKFGDYLIPSAFIFLGMGLTVMNIFSFSMPIMLIGLFFVGMTLSLVTPQLLVAVANIVDESNSAMATSLVTCIAPGLGGFFSPIVFTNLTQAIAGDSTNFRYQFVGIFCLIVGAIVTVITRARIKRAAAE